MLLLRAPFAICVSILGDLEHGTRQLTQPITQISSGGYSTCHLSYSDTLKANYQRPHEGDEYDGVSNSVAAKGSDVLKHVSLRVKICIVQGTQVNLSMTLISFHIQTAIIVHGICNEYM